MHLFGKWKRAKKKKSLNRNNRAFDLKIRIQKREILLKLETFVSWHVERYFLRREDNTAVDIKNWKYIPPSHHGNSLSSYSQHLFSAHIVSHSCCLVESNVTAASTSTPLSRVLYRQAHIRKSLKSLMTQTFFLFFRKVIANIQNECSKVVDVCTFSTRHDIHSSAIRGSR